jgi:hypothetical protein
VRRAAPPLHIWHIWLRVVGENITAEFAAYVQARLHYFDTSARVEDGDLILRMRIVGHIGPASAVGDAQHAALFETARAGIRSSRVDVVHARRVSASYA